MTGSRYHIQIPPTTELHRREIELRLNMLRDFAGQHERWFNSVDEVLQYVNDIGVRNPRTDKRIGLITLRRWRRKCGFPYAKFHNKRTPVVTSNLMIMAWLWSYRVYKATKPYKPNTKDLPDATSHLV
jgi:hypothetical protein